ncbi:MAG: hypothetical protein NT154_20915 [Verrucomicrobia bacterium]|nr:hypothetical protein [Verrucomicrobiota bacterium]
MKTQAMLLALSLAASTCLLTAQDGSQRREAPRPGRTGGPGGFHLLPPPVQEQLNLTTDQQKKMTELEAEVKVKVEKILTPEQLKLVQQIGPPERLGRPGREDAPPPADGSFPPRREDNVGSPGGLGGLGGGPGGMGGQRPVNPLVEALDLNKDGTIDADEIAKASVSLKKLDKNGDGKLTQDEFRPQRPGGAGAPGGPGGPGGEGRRGAPGWQGGSAQGGAGGQGSEGRPQRPPSE